MKSFPERLPEALQRGLAPVYLVAGSERLLVEEACDAIRDAARKAGIGERIRLSADARFDWNELARATETGSLFASQRLVELRLPTGKPGAEGGKTLRGWVDEARDDVLLVICDAWELNQEKAAWVKAIDGVGVYVPCWAVKPDRLPQWIDQRVRSRGLALDGEAARFLAARLEGNLLAAAQEVDRLALLFPGATLTLDTVQEAVADNARFDGFRLTDLVLSGQPGPALRCIRGLRETDAPPPAVLWALGRELEIAREVAHRSAQEPMARVFGALRVWKARQGPIQACIRRLGPARLDRAIGTLARLDSISKGRAFGDFWVELERLCVSLAASPSRPGRAA